VTLNAALSDDPPGIATPIGLLLRELLSSVDYHGAVAALETRPISCDCLLLVVGTKEGEMCVVERTPSRSETRGTSSGAIVVTNDYRSLVASEADAERSATLLRETSCGRFSRASFRVDAERPTSEESCYAILEDEGIEMTITVQQMVMSANRGSLSLRSRN